MTIDEVATLGIAIRGRSSRRHRISIRLVALREIYMLGGYETSPSVHLPTVTSPSCKKTVSRARRLGRTNSAAPGHIANPLKFMASCTIMGEMYVPIRVRLLFASAAVPSARYENTSPYVPQRAVVFCLALCLLHSSQHNRALKGTVVQ